MRHAGLLAAIASLAVASCETVPRVPIEGDDSTTFVALRADFSIGRAAREGRSSESVVLTHSRSDGVFEQDVASGTAIQLDDVTFNGPAVVDAEYDVRRTALAYRFEGVETSDVWIAPFAGIGYEVVELSLSDGTAFERGDYRPTGLLGGARLEWTAAAGLTVFGELELQSGRGGGLTNASTTTWAVGIELHLVPHVALLAGYQNVEIEFVTDRSTRSDVELDLSGALFALEFSN